MGREWLQNSGRRMGDGAKGLGLGRPQLPESKSVPRKGFSITHQRMRNKSELHAVCDLSHIVHNKCVHAVSVCQFCFLI